MRLNTEQKTILRGGLENFFVKNPNSSKAAAVNHFLKQGFARSTIYQAIDRRQYGRGLHSVRDAPRSGRPRKLDKKKLKRLRKRAENRIGVSQRKLALSFDVAQRTIGRNLKQQGLKYYKRDKTPRYTEEEEKKVKMVSGRLLRNHFKTGISIIIDDEKYFGFYNDEDPANAGFYTSDISTTPHDVRCKGKEKYPEKILVWIAMSERGISEPLFRKQGACAINRWIYRDECLKPKLLPFIKQYHADNNCIFWPDKASCHYANEVEKWLAQEKIDLVPYEDNPTNLPQARPIENFWSVLSDKVYAGGWSCQTEEHLRRRIRAKLQEIDQSLYQSIMASVRTKLRTIHEKGPRDKSLFK
jgi:transposase